MRINNLLYLNFNLNIIKIMQIGFWQIAIVIALVVLLFGRGKISELMGDVAKGIKSFKKGLNDDPNNNKSISDNDNNKSES